jgi:hypothetical protein
VTTGPNPDLDGLKEFDIEIVFATSFGTYLHTAKGVAREGCTLSIQFQDESINLGLPDADTVDFVGAGVTATRVGNKITVTIPGSIGGAAPVLVLSLVGAANGTFDGSGGTVYFSNWNGTVRQTSADATWNEANDQIEFTQTGLYEITIVGRIEPVGAWPTEQVFYGSDVIGPVYDPQGARHAASLTGWQASVIGHVAFTDSYVVNIDDIAIDTVTPRLYANAYADSTAAAFSALMLVRRIGDAISGY